MKRTVTARLTVTALCLALALVLPFLTGQIPKIGNLISPMHYPVFLCGLLCGWPWGLAVGFIAPVLRSLLFSMPVLYPQAIAMAFELATYGFLSGFLCRRFPKNIGFLYLNLLLSMLAGRVVWGAARFALAGLSATKFPLSVFLAGAVIDAAPAVVLQLLLLPPLYYALRTRVPRKR